MNSETLLVNNQVRITGLGRTTLRTKVHSCGLRQGKTSVTDIQTGILVRQITREDTRTVYSTMANCYGMTFSVTTTKDTFASKYECTPLTIPISPFSTYRWHMTAVTPTDRPKSFRNSCVIKGFGCVFMLSRFFLDCSVGVGMFVTGLSQTSGFKL